MRISRILVTLALLPAGLFAASKEQQEMQRDIAQLQDQVRALQSSFDQKMAGLQVLVQQALDAGNKANTGVSVLSSNVNQTLERELKQSLVPVASLAAKVDNTNNDMAEVRNQVSDLNSSMNKIMQLLGDLNTAVKVMQAPPAAPPGVAPATAGPGGPPAAAAAVPASVLFANAARDQNGGHADLAISEFNDFIKFYPDDPNAAAAQFSIGDIHYAKNQLDLAIKDYDAVIERYSDNLKVTPDAYFMKGMSLKQSAKKDAAATTFRALIAKYPNSTQATTAAGQLRAMGFTVAAPATGSRRKPR